MSSKEKYLAAAEQTGNYLPKDIVAFRSSMEGGEYLTTLIELTLQIGASYEEHEHVLGKLTRESLRFFIESSAVILNNESLDPDNDEFVYDIVDRFIETEMDALVLELIDEQELEVDE